VVPFMVPACLGDMAMVGRRVGMMLLLGCFGCGVRWMELPSL